MENIPIPEYNNNTSYPEFLRKLEQYQEQINRKKYNLILDFINELLNNNNNIKYSSITEFKNIKISKLLNNTIHNNNIINKFIPQFIKLFGIEEINNNEQSLIKYLKTILDKINYKLVPKNFNDEICYSIKLIPLVEIKKSDYNYNKY
jgi:hypothetical protein